MKQGNLFLALIRFGIVDYTYIILHFCQQPCCLHRSKKEFQIVHFNITPNLKVRKQNNVQIKPE